MEVRTLLHFFSPILLCAVWEYTSWQMEKEHLSRGSLIKVHFSPGCLKKAICVPEVRIFFHMPSNILGHFLWFELSYQVMSRKQGKKRDKNSDIQGIFIYFLKVDALVCFAIPSSAIPKHKHTHTYTHSSIKQHLFIVLCWGLRSTVFTSAEFWPRD